MALKPKSYEVIQGISFHKGRENINPILQGTFLFILKE